MSSPKDYANVYESIMEWVHIPIKLKAHGINLPEIYIVPRILSSLHPEFGMINTTFNTQDESWSVTELITRCFAEDEKIIKNMCLGAYIVIVLQPSILLEILFVSMVSLEEEVN